MSYLSTLLCCFLPRCLYPNILERGSSSPCTLSLKTGFAQWIVSEFSLFSTSSKNLFRISNWFFYFCLFLSCPKFSLTSSLPSRGKSLLLGRRSSRGKVFLKSMAGPLLTLSSFWASFWIWIEEYIKLIFSVLFQSLEDGPCQIEFSVLIFNFFIQFLFSLGFLIFLKRRVKNAHHGRKERVVLLQAVGIIFLLQVGWSDLCRHADQEKNRQSQLCELHNYLIWAILRYDMIRVCEISTISFLEFQKDFLRVSQSSQRSLAS